MCDEDAFKPVSSLRELLCTQTDRLEGYFCVSVLVCQVVATTLARRGSCESQPPRSTWVIVGGVGSREGSLLLLFLMEK